MKNLVRKIIVVLAALCLLPSCKDWLGVTSATNITAEEQFQTVGGFKDALTGAYIGMGQRNLYAKDMTWHFVDILSQQYAPLDQLARYNKVQEYLYKDRTVMPKIDGMWSDMYTVIANINLALDFINKKREVLGPINYDIIKGELLGLRAFLHFDLMRLFSLGNLAERPALSGKLSIPYVTEFTKVPTERRSYPKTFNLLVNDIKKALELLKTDPIYINPQRPEDFYDGLNADGFYDDRERRMNYYAAKALQARVLLWLGGTENLNAAIAAAEEVIQDGPFQLIDAANYPVTEVSILYPEIIFGLEIDEFRDIINRYLRIAESTNYDALFMTEAMVEEVYETDKVRVGLVDIRYTKLIQELNNGFRSIKLLQNDVDFGIMPLIKLPEMYYIAAEAYAKTGSLQKAVNYLNKVRESRGIVKKIPASANRERILIEIKQEYRKEYVMEGQLFFYYKRLGLTDIPFYSSQGEVAEDVYLLPYPDSETTIR